MNGVELLKKLSNEEFKDEQVIILNEDTFNVSFYVDSSSGYQILRRELNHEEAGMSILANSKNNFTIKEREYDFLEAWKMQSNGIPMKSCCGWIYKNNKSYLDKVKYNYGKEQEEYKITSLEISQKWTRYIDKKNNL